MSQRERALVIVVHIAPSNISHALYQGSISKKTERALGGVPNTHFCYFYEELDWILGTSR